MKLELISSYKIKQILYQTNLSNDDVLCVAAILVHKDSEVNLFDISG